MSFLDKIFGNKYEKPVKKYRPLVDKINSFETKISSLSDDDLRGMTAVFKERMAKGESLDDILPEAFATVREASKRTLGLRHFDVQLIGGAVLHDGNISEMKTGEGKTLVATLPAYLNALSGNGVHVVTVNDYLSRRDAVWMGQVYDALGLTVAVINHEASYLYDKNHRDETRDIQHETTEKDKRKDKLDKERDEVGSFKVVHEFLKPCTRRQAYEADITYGTNNEFGFDYLRDNLEYEQKDLRQREHNYAIVDEIDSILIDEARTPLIISSATTDSEKLYVDFARIAEKMNKEEDFKVDEKLKASTLTDAGIEKAQKILGIENIYTEGGVKLVHHLETAVRAKALFHKDKEYVVKGGEVVIVDEFTGRLQPGRRWSEGLHQAIEAKEGVAIQKESRTFASITFQNYFRMYKKLSGMTGTAVTSAEEFLKVYRLDTVVIPTNVPVARKDENDLIFQTENGKFKAIALKVKELHQKGQPVLIGTVSIEKNELLSGFLSREGVPHEVLNAKNHEREGEIIAQAGRKGAVTIATNMAGRGVDIKLGGIPAIKEEAEIVKSAGGLFVLGTERHEARRIDNQLRGRSGRQGDPGETQFFVSLEDSLMRIFASDTIKKMMGRFNIPEEMPIENRIITRSLETAQTKIEGFNFDSRKHVLEYDDVMNHQRKTVYARRRKLLVGDREDIKAVLEDFMLGEPEEIRAQIELKKSELGEENFYNISKRVMLQTIDLFWVDHLEAMDYMRSSVNLRAYGQRDPLVEYKKEGLHLFRDMQEATRRQVLDLIPRIDTRGIRPAEAVRLEETRESARAIGEGTRGSEISASASAGHAGPKVGRNDPCPCGSGKKYKKCHGA